MMKETDKTKKYNIFQRLKKEFSELSTVKKVQAIIASVLTMLLMIALPVYAWFALGGKLEAFTKIKEPDNLDIRAGHYDDVKYFNLNDIDIESIAAGTPHRVVFSVNAGDYKIPYQIQLAHTTNIPFKYRIYRASESTSAADATYVTYTSELLKEKGETNYTFYYIMGDEIPLTAKNPDPDSITNYGRQLALGSGDYYKDTYDVGDDPEIYAVPIYEQSGKITYDSSSDHDYYILEISFDETATAKDGFSDWNIAANKKETDMIYLTASRWSGD
ncbi:hypothetical protein [Ruminococcus flavefaciens]|uniref:hypothetical protein n=1 Tax=Ruminococcus flavefaciens TaxID=1265 RepID=UPI0026EA73D6|nr:hypothetical protein [Ruminococcus flavefaciens]